MQSKAMKGLAGDTESEIDDSDIPDDEISPLK